jgi:hypothetical protein
MAGRCQGGLSIRRFTQRKYAVTPDLASALATQV